MNKRRMAKLEKRVSAVAVAASNAADQRVVASGVPLVMKIGEGLYRVSASGEKELIRLLPPRTRLRGRAKRSKT